MTNERILSDLAGPISRFVNTGLGQLTDVARQMVAGQLAAGGALEVHVELRPFRVTLELVTVSSERLDLATLGEGIASGATLQ